MIQMIDGTFSIANPRKRERGRRFVKCTLLCDEIRKSTLCLNTSTTKNIE